MCFYLCGQPGRITLAIGVCWLALGVLYGAWRTSWFRKPLEFARLSTDEGPAPTARP